LPFARQELEAIKTNEDANTFAPAANHMALDFISAFGIGPTDEKHEEYKDQLENYLSGPRKEMPGRAHVFQLEGYMWQLFPHARKALFWSANPQNRLMQQVAGKYLRPPLEYTTSLVVTASLAHNDFCTPNTAPIIVNWARQTTRTTFSEEVRTTRCWVARVRPGATFIQIARCSISTEGEEDPEEPGEDEERVADWRIKVQGNLIGGNLLMPHATGLLGNALTSATNVGTALIMSAAAVSWGFLSFEVIDRLAPMLQKSSPMALMLMLAAESSGALAILTAATLVAGGERAFTSAITSFLSFLADQGVVEPMGSVVPKVDPFRISSSLVVIGSIIHRVKHQRLERGPALMGEPVHVGGVHRLLYGASSIGEPTMVTKTQKLVNINFQNWNFAEIGLAIPFAGRFTLNARIEINFDITPWYEAWKDGWLFTQNKERIDKCKACHWHGQAFCNWRDVLADLWKPSMDVCVDNTGWAQLRCTSANGVLDEEGHQVLATFIAPRPSDLEDHIADNDTEQWLQDQVAQASVLTQLSAGARCDEMTYVGANQAFEVSRAMNNFFLRH